MNRRYSTHRLEKYCLTAKNRHEGAIPTKDGTFLASEKIRDLLECKEVLSTQLTRQVEEYRRLTGKIETLQRENKDLLLERSCLQYRLENAQCDLLNKDRLLSSAITVVPFEVKLGVMLIQAFPHKVRIFMRVLVAFLVAFRRSS